MNAGIFALSTMVLAPSAAFSSASLFSTSSRSYEANIFFSMPVSIKNLRKAQAVTQTL
jgi:hypothetical protein